MYVISIAHTWLGLLTSSPRSRYCHRMAGPSPAGVGLAVQRLDALRRISVAMSLRRMSPSWRIRPRIILCLQTELKVQLIDAAHQSETGFDRPWPVVMLPRLMPTAFAWRARGSL